MRFLFFVLVGVILFFVIRAKLRRPLPPAPVDGAKHELRQCCQCATWLPKENIITIDERSYCSPRCQHLGQEKN